MTESTIRPAVEADVPVILELIRGLAEYERAPDQVVCDEARLRDRSSARSRMRKSCWRA